MKRLSFRSEARNLEELGEANLAATLVIGDGAKRNEESFLRQFEMHPFFQGKRI